ncbi:MAG: helix-turn-helix domain-containing protein [Opitutaceae bacterium]|nr:helix-turn-helix domain-containing protein [Opitutaceae bacterium]
MLSFLMPPGQSVPLEIKPFEEMGAVARASAPHRHSFYAIFHVTGGRGTHVVDFKSHPIRPPALWFISPRQVHSWDTTAPLRGQVLPFTEEFLRVTAGADSGMRELAFFHDLEGASELRLSAAANQDISAVLQALADEYGSAALNREPALRAWLQLLLIKAQRLYATQKPRPAATATAALARKFIQLVTEQFIQERSVPVYARQIGVSTGHLHDLVKQGTGLTPQQIIRRELVLEAKRLLAHTELTIAEISYRLAMEDPAYFGRFFKRETGRTPGAFRKRIREKHQSV